MFLAFLDALRAGGIPAGLTEHLALLEALRAGEPGSCDVDDFYALARATYCRDETQLDRFDRIFAALVRGLAPPAAEGEGVAVRALPEAWLRQLAQRHLSPEDMARVEALGGWDALMQALRERLAEQRGRHEGGSKWIGTGGTSPFGAHGYNPEGVRIGQEAGRHRRAVKVWDERRFRDLDDRVEIGTRQIKLALRRLRRFAREGAAEELDLDDTIRATARQGWLDVRLRPERHNAMRLLLLLDVGGSMDEHVRLCEQLFSAARSEFRNLEFFYFHNCPYERLWKDNRRRHTHAMPTWDVINTFGREWRLLIVGDAAMSPYELTVPGGSVEHMNPEPGLVWLERLTGHWSHAAWLNPVPEAGWGWSQSTTMVQAAMAGRMFPLTLAGLEAATRTLGRRG